MIITSIKYFVKDIKSYVELAKKGETVVAEDEEVKIVLTKKDNIKSFK